MYSPKIISEPTNDIHVSEMKDGDVAVIVKWPTTAYIGSVIQMHRTKLTQIGGIQEWSPIPSPGAIANVRLLPPGTTFKIKEGGGVEIVGDNCHEHWGECLDLNKCVFGIGQSGTLYARPLAGTTVAIVRPLAAGTTIQL